MMGENIYAAHSPNDFGKWHRLDSHLLATAMISKKFASAFGADDAGFWCGVLHDLGKVQEEFQEYLRGTLSKGPEHSGSGAHFAQSKLKNPALAWVIAGHHGGLPNRAKLQARLASDLNQRSGEHWKVLSTILSEKVNKTPNDLDFLPEWIMHENRKGDFGKRQFELFVRMLYSALVDADFLDTERHFNIGKSKIRKKRQPSIKILWEHFRVAQLDFMVRANGKNPSPLNALRREMYDLSITASIQEPGIFRLPAPTGGGKTRMSLGFALKHAVEYGKRRVIYAIPYTSIIEQTVKVFRDDIFKGVTGAVLEHHSAVIWNETDGSPDPTEQRRRLASENWDAPIVVTTTVQLFESLFANKSSACRKLHRIANSVLILDEVQTLPTEVIEPTLEVLQALVDHYGVTVLLCTATQPALEMAPGFSGLKNIRDVFPEPYRFFSKLERVSYDFKLDKQWTWNQLAEAALQKTQSLTILNTKKDAEALARLLKEKMTNGLSFLSTNLCGAHRTAVLDEIKKTLQEKRQCHLVSTQVVEAGVDIDFPLVLRAMGPMDRIVQAAGRCNREGSLEKGEVIVFEPLQGSRPQGSYATAYDTARIMLDKGVNLHDPSLYQAYFRELYAHVVCDAYDVQPVRGRLDFPETAKRYKIIKDDSFSVVVRWKPHVHIIDKLIDQVLSGLHPCPRILFRKLQPYMVSIPLFKQGKLLQDGWVSELCDNLLEWTGRYDDLLGIQEDYLDPGDLIIGNDGREAEDE